MNSYTEDRDVIVEYLKKNPGNFMEEFLENDRMVDYDVREYRERVAEEFVNSVPICPSDLGMVKNEDIYSEHPNHTKTCMKCWSYSINKMEGSNE